jgi:YfiH family protein
VTTGITSGWVVTDRRGVGSVAGSHRSTAPIGEDIGRSRPPYDSFNLGMGVGDDPQAVAANRARLAAAVGLAPGQLIWLSQVHGTRVVEVSGPLDDPVPGTDALVSTVPGIGLAVLVADCVPVLLADRSAGVIGAAHAGRVGAADGIVLALLARMTALGARPERIESLVGPSICGRCYEVPAAMRDEVDSRLPGSAAVTADGTAGLDLRAGIATQLRAAGVVSVQIDNRCTREDLTLYSHRRAVPSGRFAAVIRQ